MNQRITKMKSSLLLVLATIALPVWGEKVNENTARQVATQMMSQSSETRDSADTTQLKSQAQPKTLQLIYKSSKSKTTNVSTRAAKADADETVYFYVFGAENNKGFVIVAGDDRITPVLGYSPTNGFPVDNMPPNLKWWLGEYARQIQFAIDNNIEPTVEVKKQWAQYIDNKNNEKEEE